MGMQIFAKTLLGKVMTLDVNTGDTIGMVKHQILDKSGNPRIVVWKNKEGPMRIKDVRVEI